MNASSKAIASLAKAHSLYKAALSPLLHAAGVNGGCRFQPTCSEYATIALSQHGLARGLWLAFTRLLRCQPFARGGWDPVPPRTPSEAPHGPVSRSSLP